MIQGADSFATRPFATVATSYAVQSLFSALIANQDADRAYLLDCQPYDPGTAAIVDVGFSANLTRPILGARAWPARLSVIVNTETRLFSDEIGRSGSSSFGVLRINIGDGEHDDILNYAWDGRQVRVLMGAEGMDLAAFQPVFVGTAADIEYDERFLSIILRDKSELLRTPIQTTLYAGSGGIEGNTDLKNQPKPLCFGEVYNIEPVLVDRANLIYQVHDGSIEAVNAVYDGALALTAAGDVPDITAALVSPGEFKTQLSGGYIKLGAEPAKRLTADVEGFNDGGYVSTAADIIEQIILGYTTLTASDINAQSFAATNTANSAAVGWYGNSGLVFDVIADLIGSIGGSFVFNRSGELTLGVFSFSTSVGTVPENDIISLQRVRTSVPTWRRQIGYAKSWTVQGQEDVLAAATDARKNFVAQPYRYAISEDNLIRTRRVLAGTAEINTLLVDGAAASTEATRQQSIFGEDRNIYRAVAKRQQFKYRPGQTITISYPRFGFPRDVVILSVVENTERRYTELRVFA